MLPVPYVLVFISYNYDNYDGFLKMGLLAVLSLINDFIKEAALLLKHWT